VMTTMAVVVVVVWGAIGTPIAQGVIESAAPPIILLGISTALSRLAMFASVQALGSVRTAVIAILEIAVSLTLAFFILGDRLTSAQWIGVALLLGSVMLVRAKDLTPRRLQININTLIVRDMSSIQFQRIAFHRAFGKADQDNEFGIMSQITTQELQAIQRMMGANTHIDPFPLVRPPQESAGNTYLTPDELTRFLDDTDRKA
jgi:uncharacterized membrane protein